MNTDQIEFWNGTAGEKWVTHADQLDELLSPFLEAVLSQVQPVENEHFLDIGCGAGALTLETSRQVGPERGAIGVDVSKPLLKLAEARASKEGAPATFECADASIF